MSTGKLRHFVAYALVPGPGGKVYLGEFDVAGLSDYVAWNKAAKMFPDCRDELWIKQENPPGIPFRPEQLETGI